MTKAGSPTTVPAPALSPGLRRFLYFTAMVTGAAILVVEILGAKMLSPFVGTSHFVWTAQIAITLASLAAGYYFGGWLVDRSPRLSRLYFCIAAAAAYLALSVLIVERVAYQFLNFNLAVGALLSSAVLFFVPLTLLAAVGPFLVRVLVLSFHVIGSQVGRLSALSTVGSMLGTVLIGYVIIPFLPNSVTMCATAGVLFAICITYYLVWSRKQIAPVAALLAIAAVMGGAGIYRELNSRPANMNELYRHNSNFGMLQVIETRNSARRFYLNDFLVQNTYDSKEKKSLSLFTYMLYYLPQVYRAEIRDVLVIGLGVGIVPMQFAEDGASVDAVEINPDVVDLGRRFFDLDPARMNLIIGDGRYVVNKTRKTYDAIVLDAFLGDASPSHLMTREAFESIRRTLKPGGILAVNSFGDFEPGKNFFVTSLHKTLTNVFPSVQIHATGNGNVFFAASTQPLPNRRAVSTEQAHPEVKRELDLCLNATVTPPADAGIVLTDDFNPVEFFDAHNREAHRRRLALSIGNL